MPLRCTVACALLLFVPALLPAESLTLPRDQRPEWLRRDGIVMAGSWEPLLFRVRRDGAEGYTPTPQQQADYLREHSPEMIAKLQAVGVNFVMMHCYKGAGLQAERQSMNDAVRFSKLCHDAGLHVGVYNYSGAFIWELFFKEMPQARDWILLDQRHNPILYGRQSAYRYYWNRNHPDAEAFYQRLVRFAINDIKTDLVHFDNYTVGPGYDTLSIERFRRYLEQTFSPRELAEARIDAATAQPPATGDPELLRRAWLDFASASLAESYRRMSRFSRGLRPDILVELNPGGVLPTIDPPVDHGRLLQGGEAYWDEGPKPGYQNGRLVSRIRTCKVARATGNMAFSYITTPLEAAESMAFNQDGLGAICWFEYGRIVDRPGSQAPMSDQLAPYVRFYRQRRDLLRDATVVADAAVLRSFPSQAFDPKSASLTAKVEDALILGRKPFQIIYDHQLADLSRYRTLVLAGCVAMSDVQIEQIRRYVAGGGRLCIIGPAATHDAWMRPRSKPALQDLPAPLIVRIPANGDWFQALRDACPEGLSLCVWSAKADPAALPLPIQRKEDMPSGLCCELTEQRDRYLVHLVNYRGDGPMPQVTVRLALPAGRSATSVTLSSPEHEDLSLTYTSQDRIVTFTVPQVRVYEIAVVEMK